jgi:hypothetical protein
MSNFQEFPKGLYRVPGPDVIDGVACELLTVADEAAQEAAESDGWHVSLSDAVADVPAQADEQAPTREALEAQATELGLKFDGRTSDKKLAALIAEKLAA